MGSTPGYVWTTAIVGAVLALPLWRITQHAITLVHEGGHALIGLMFGGVFGKGKIELNRGGGGSTHIEVHGLGDVLSDLAGYLGPSVVGYAGAQMLVHDFEPRSVLMISLAFSIFVLVLVRNAFGLLVAGATVVLLWTAVTRAEPAAQRGIAYVWVWFVLMGSTRTIPALIYATARQEGKTDAEHLQQSTHISDVLWLLVFWLGTLAALVFGGALMLRHAA